MCHLILLFCCFAVLLILLCIAVLCCAKRKGEGIFILENRRVHYFGEPVWRTSSENQHASEKKRTELCVIWRPRALHLRFTRVKGYCGSPVDDVADEASHVVRLQIRVSMSCISRASASLLFQHTLFGTVWYYFWSTIWAMLCAQILDLTR